MNKMVFKILFIEADQLELIPVGKKQLTVSPSTRGVGFGIMY